MIANIFLSIFTNIVQAIDLSAIFCKDHYSIKILSNFDGYIFVLSADNFKSSFYLYTWIGNCFISKPDSGLYTRFFIYSKSQSSFYLYTKPYTYSNLYPVFTFITWSTGFLITFWDYQKPPRSSSNWLAALLHPK